MKRRHKVKITVIKCAWHQDLVDKYANPGLEPCTYNKEGMTFISNGWQKPAGLCDNAWKSMMEYVFALSHGGENFYDGELKNKKAFIASCNDGFRPVSYLIEALDEDVDEMFED